MRRRQIVRGERWRGDASYKFRRIRRFRRRKMPPRTRRVARRRGQRQRRVPVAVVARVNNDLRRTRLGIVPGPGTAIIPLRVTTTTTTKPPGRPGRNDIALDLTRGGG